MQRLSGATAYDRDGLRLGVVSDVLLDDDSAEPTLLAVADGDDVFFVPAAGAAVEGRSVLAPVTRSQVLAQPATDFVSGHLSGNAVAALLDYFGRPVPDRPATDGAELTVSREVLDVTTHWVPYERVRLRTYVTTETRTITVEVRTEHVVVDSEPFVGTDVDGEGRAAGVVVPPRLAQPRDIEVILHEERPEVVLRVVPVERVRLRVDTTTDHGTFTAAVRVEELEIDQHPSDGVGRAGHEPSRRSDAGLT